jgi:hypothetical protein
VQSLGDKIDNNPDQENTSKNLDYESASKEIDNKYFDIKKEGIDYLTTASQKEDLTASKMQSTTIVFQNEEYTTILPQNELYDSLTSQNINEFNITEELTNITEFQLISPSEDFTTVNSNIGSNSDGVGTFVQTGTTESPSYDSQTTACDQQQGDCVQDEMSTPLPDDVESSLNLRETCGPPHKFQGGFQPYRGKYTTLP